MGYPDDGNGRYITLRPYSEQLAMSEAKKVHSDELEHVVTLAPLSLVNGIVYPWTTVGLLSFYLFGRMMYTNGLLTTDGEAKMIVG